MGVLGDTRGQAGREKNLRHFLWNFTQKVDQVLAQLYHKTKSEAESSCVWNQQLVSLEFKNQPFILNSASAT
jgi:hypothetical protein